jgi:protein O-mannosyl-transferase
VASWPSKKTLACVVIGVAASVCLVGVYHAVLGAEFTNWDDDRFIVSNPLFAAGGWAYVKAAFTQIQFEAYQPLHLLSYVPDRYLWAGSAAGFHILNMALFAVDLALLWRVVRRHTSDVAALAAIALFSLHPLCVEPVAWVTDRKDVLMLLFFLLALGAEDEHVGMVPRPRALVFYLCALLTKSSSVCFPVVLFAWLHWVRGRPAREALVRSVAYAAAAFVVSIAVFLIWRDHGMIVREPAGARTLDMASTFATYVGRVFWPSHLAPVYPNQLPNAVTALVLVGLGLVATKLFWRRFPSRARFAVIVFVAVLLPVSNVVPMTLRFADRYAFPVLAMLALPFASALDWLVEQTEANVAAVCGLLTVVVVSLAGLEARATASLVPVWRSSRTLWAHAVAAQPRAFLARLKYGETLRDAHEWSAATLQYRAAARLDPRSLSPLMGLFSLQAMKAESEGLLPAGTAARWRDDVSRAAADRPEYQHLFAEVDSSRCRSCGNMLIVVGLSAWPRTDAELIALARRSLALRSWDRAQIYLAQIQDRTLPEAAELERLADGMARSGGR